jgi:hypothetical protein
LAIAILGLVLSLPFIPLGAPIIAGVALLRHDFGMGIYRATPFAISVVDGELYPVAPMANSVDL